MDNRPQLDAKSHKVFAAGLVILFGSEHLVDEIAA